MRARAERTQAKAIGSAASVRDWFTYPSSPSPSFDLRSAGERPLLQLPKERYCRPVVIFRFSFFRLSPVYFFFKKRFYLVEFSKLTSNCPFYFVACPHRFSSEKNSRPVPYFRHNHHNKLRFSKEGRRNSQHTTLS